MNCYFLKKGKSSIRRNRGISSGIIITAIIIAIIAIGSGVYIATRSQAAEFEVSDLSITPSSVAPSDQVSVSVTVRNIGEAKGDHTVKLKIDNSIENTRKITLSGGENEILTFTVQKETEKTYSVKIENLTQNFEVVSPAEFITSNLSVNPTQVKPGEDVTVSVNVTNEGDLTGEHTVKLKINGTTENTKTITLNSGESETLTFTTQKETEKTYSVKIENLTQNFEVVSEAAPSPYYEVKASVDRVWDGDTIDVEIENKVTELDPEGEVYEGNIETVRFGGGIDAPEDPEEEGGPESTEFMDNLLDPGNTVYLDLDNFAEGGNTGRPYRGYYERLIAVIYKKIDNQWVNINAELLRWGMKEFPGNDWDEYTYIYSEFDMYNWPPYDNDYPYVRGASGADP